MDLEQLRHNWQRARVNSDYLQADNRRLAEELAAGRARTARQELARYYRISSACAVWLPLLSPMLVHVLGFPVWIAVVYAVFGVVMGVLNLCFSRYIRRSDCTDAPIVKALANAVKIARYQRYIRTFGIAAAVVLITTMFAEALSQSEYELLVAMIIGGILGTIIGIAKFRRMSSLAKQMQDELRSLLHDSQ